MKFVKDQWEGNKWASIDIEPIESDFALKVLLHLSKNYGFEMPAIHDTLDGFFADFVVLRSNASIHLDNWTFSIAFKESFVRDQILSDLVELPDDYFS